MTRKTFLRRLLAATLLVGFAGVSTAPAWARGGSESGGRIYRPSRLRTPREPRPPGRKMSRPPIPEPEQRQPLRSSALIPNPEPRSRGGSGYARKGKYFYELPREIELKRLKNRRGYRPSIPRPERIGTTRHGKDGRRRR